MTIIFELEGTVGPIQFYRRLSLPYRRNLYIQTREEDLIITHWFEIPTEAQLADFTKTAPWEELRPPRLTEFLNLD